VSGAGQGILTTGAAAATLSRTELYGALAEAAAVTPAKLTAANRPAATIMR
jgi:hypothetical protein